MNFLKLTFIFCHWLKKFAGFDEKGSWKEKQNEKL